MINQIINIDDSKFVCYKIIPDYTINNSNNDVLAKAISTLYKTPMDRFKIQLNNGFKVTYKLKESVIFDVLLFSNDAGFYLTVPKKYEDLFINKLRTIWNRSAITKVNKKDLNNFDIYKCEIAELVLKDYNFKSLSTSKSDLYPLTNMLGITTDLRDKEKVRVNYNIRPVKRRDWISTVKDLVKDFKQGRTVDREKTLKEEIKEKLFNIANMTLEYFIEFRLMIFEAMFGIIMPEKDEDKNKVEIKIETIEAIKEDNKLSKLSSDTTYKMTSEAYDVKINIISQSENRERRRNNLISVSNSFKDLNGDNELIMRDLSIKEQKKRLNSIKKDKRQFKLSTKSIYSDKEVAKFIQLPQKTLQQLYNLDNIDTREVEIPKELQKGKIEIGTAEKQRKVIKTYFSTDKNIAGLPIIISGPQNAGKTTFLKNIIKDSHYKAKYSNIYIDFIENCHNSTEVSEVIPEEEKVVIRLGDKEYIPALAYNEVSKLITKDMDPWDRVRYANMLSEQVEYLINSVTDKSTGELTAQMLRYLHAASMVTFIKPGATVNDVFEVLRKWQVRNEFIRYAKYESECFDKEDDIFYDLEELHERDTIGKIIGTRENLIIGIINRITILKKNQYLKAMLKADVSKDIDFTKLIEKGKSIFIQIPQNKFPNPKTKDILCTFFMSRIWLTVQLRENNKNARLCKVIFDEVYQVPTCASFLKNHITEFRRHRLGLIITCHYFKQFKDLFDAIKSAGTSYILIAGTEKENLEKLKEELLPFTIEDGLNLKPYHSLNVINYGNQYAKFITKLPKPIKY